jgi:hypothetical protein
MTTYLHAGACCLALLAAAGCSTMVFENKPVNERGLWYQTRVRTYWDWVGWDQEFTAAQRTVSVHPDDGGPSAGAATVDVDGIEATVRVGLLGAVGPRACRFLVGTDVRVNPQYDSDNFDDTDLHDKERQPLGAGYDSYAYGLFDTGDYTIIPFIGVESIIADNLIFGLEYSRPRTKLTWETGHYRYDELQAVTHDSWESFGHGGRARAGYIFDKDLGYLGLEYGHTRYDAEFSGIDTDISTNTVSLVFEARF